MRTLKALLLFAIAAVLAVVLTPPPAHAATVRADSVAVAPCARVAVAAPGVVRVASVNAVPLPNDSAAVLPRSHAPLTRAALVTLLLASVMGVTLSSTAQDKNSYPAMDTVRAQHNNALKDLWYYIRNHIGTLAPGVAMATTTQKAKTVNSCQYVRGGIPRAALGASDNFWDLTTAGQGTGVVAAGSFIIYRLCVTAAEAAKVISSTVASTQAGCAFAAPMADGDVILATLVVATDASHTFTPGTTALNATGITATFTDGPDSSEILGQLVTP